MLSKTSALHFAISLALAIPAFGQTDAGGTNGRGLSFAPDFRFEGSSLQGWQSIGGAEWRAENGELIATAKADAPGGLLILNRSYQDAGVHAVFKGAAGSEAGFVFRLEKATEGMKGVLVSIKDGESGAYAVTFDAAGKELTREKLKPPTGYPMVRMAPSGSA